MPHLNIEYTRNLRGFDPLQALARINRACLDSGLFSESDIKSRATAIDCFLVGIEEKERGFLHARIALLSGRSNLQRKELADVVLAALRSSITATIGSEIQVSVETVEIDHHSYAKTLMHG